MAVIEAYIDRIEDGRAILYLGDNMEKMVLPEHFLAGEVREGDYVNISISLDAEKTESARQEALELL
ncbi:MAG: DUF3006 domain-containing protein [Selenomonadaceae bacterium]|nr:DUF3006 domain-containing protein [Selenomonadaceae bacterium]